MAVGEAVSGWVGRREAREGAGGEIGWRIMARGDWLGPVVAGTGKELFEA